MTEKIFTLKNSENYDIPIELNEFNKEYCILILHGMYSYIKKPTYVDLTNRFNNLNISNCKFNFYGHGTSKAELKNVTTTKVLAEAEIVLDNLLKNGFKKIIVIGCSLGGNIAYLLASKRKEIEGLVLKCPLANRDNMYTKEEISDWKKTRIKMSLGIKERALGYEFYIDAMTYNFQDLISKINCPVKIIHGNCDKSVPIEQSIEVSNLVKDNELLIINGANHYFTGYEKLCHNLIEKFVCEVIKND